MTRRFNPWFLAFLAVAAAAAIYGVLLLSRAAADLSLAEILLRLPASNATTVHIDVAAIRQSGMADLLTGAAVAEDPEYRRFVTESGFDWKTDLEAVTASKVNSDWYFFIRARFDLQKLRNFALSRNGACLNGVCSVAGSTPGRWVSFFPVTSRVLALSTSKNKDIIYNLLRKGGTPWTGGVPEGPAWVSFNGSVLEGDPALPAGARLFGKVLADAPRTTFSVAGQTGGLELRMISHHASAAAAENTKAQLEGVTVEFRKYFERLGQSASPGDLSGLLLSGKFTASGDRVSGAWPLHPEFIRKLAGGEL